MQTRRDFLKVAGIAGAGVAGGIAGGYTVRGLVDKPPANPVSGDLAIYNWSYYMFPPLLDEFRRQTGVSRIQYDEFESEDEVWAALEQSPSGYDLALLVGATVTAAIGNGYILPLDHRNIPNLQLLDPAFQDLQHDPDQTYSVPYLWGTTGIGVNSGVVSGTVASWADMFDPIFLQANFRKVTMIDDMRETIGAALLHLGLDVNSAEPQDLVDAKQALLDQKPYLAKYASTTEYIAALSAGDWAACHAWNGDIVQAMSLNSAIGYLVPSEGAIMWVDNFVIPAGARNKRAAEAFIDFMLMPAHEMLNTEYVGYANPNRIGTEWLPEDIRTDPVIYPDPITMSKLVTLRELDAATFQTYDDAWRDILAA